MEVVEDSLRHLLSYSPAKMGQLGDYVGGIIGTGISLLALFYLAKTFRVTQETNYYIITQQSLHQMIEAYDQATRDMTIDSIDAGRGAFTRLLNEYLWIYTVLQIQNLRLQGSPQELQELEDTLQSIEIRDEEDEDQGQHEEEPALYQDQIKPLFYKKDLIERLSIAYMIMYYGFQIEQYGGISGIPEKELSRALDVLMVRRKNKEQNSTLKGHQRRLGHYFRTLYAIYSYLDTRHGLSVAERYRLGKQVRIRLSNYEQGFLALNIISPLGRRWRQSGLLSRYQPIKNIPERFFRFDNEINLKKLFPEIMFEYEEELQVPSVLTSASVVERSPKGLSRWLNSLSQRFQHPHK